LALFYTFIFYNWSFLHVRNLTENRLLSSDVNKDLTLKAKAKDSAFKAKAKDRTFEGLNRELDI